MAYDKEYDYCGSKSVPVTLSASIELDNFPIYSKRLLRYSPQSKKMADRSPALEEGCLRQAMIIEHATVKRCVSSEEPGIAKIPATRNRRESRRLTAISETNTDEEHQEAGLNEGKEANTITFQNAGGSMNNSKLSSLAAQRFSQPSEEHLEPFSPDARMPSNYLIAVEVTPPSREYKRTVMDTTDHEMPDIGLDDREDANEGYAERFKKKQLEKRRLEEEQIFPDYPVQKTNIAGEFASAYHRDALLQLASDKSTKTFTKRGRGHGRGRGRGRHRNGQVIRETISKQPAQNVLSDLQKTSTSFCDIQPFEAHGETEKTIHILNILEQLRSQALLANRQKLYDLVNALIFKHAQSLTNNDIAQSSNILREGNSTVQDAFGDTQDNPDMVLLSQQWISELHAIENIRDG
ncbi:hypothetical protein NEOLI_001758 [Neolecta irregularis DAH-3]|uniref:Uncharacterized protein n=1 Tax=Neolecta irregularis (strain DAH-3) TaxID=1198029 RepID=A0A1U7LW22_NEOID|nr:hypothetical protein NEOLI_001758 [Neolecta irregularis DAH-3]|eukprot:OLL26880.1 hypothetical protein NEOLI_001758 [Neolecta irregularis DAH-3]